MAQQKTLDIKPFEIGLATEKLTCDDCGGSILPNYPFATRTDVRLIDGKYTLTQRTQCFRLCNGLDPTQRNIPRSMLPPERIEAEAPNPPWTFHPQQPAEIVKLAIVPVWLPGLRVANGYSRMISRQANGFVTWLLEVPSSLVEKSNFRLLSEGGPYRTWETINETGDRLTVREYLQDDYENQQDHWYMNCKVVRPIN